MKKLIILLIVLLPLRIYSQSRFFDGTDDRAITGTGLPSWFQTDKTQVTAECWIYLDALSRKNIGAMGLNGASEVVLGVEDDNKLTSMLRGTDDADGVYNSAGLTFEANKWYHVAMTYNGATRTHYINGEIDGTPQAETGLIDAWGSGQWMEIGDYGPYNYQGRVDEVRMWDYARTQTQIQSNMDKVVADEETGLQGYWQIDEEAGTLFNRSEQGVLLDIDIITGTLTVDNAPIKRIIGE